jgi:triosephosphate isomerase
MQKLPLKITAKITTAGCLVGGASLDATKFGRIMNFQKK